MFGRTSDSKKRAARQFAVVMSGINDPAVNLAWEHHLFSNYEPGTGEEYEILMFYVNSPSVIFGKHQNPWKECNVAYNRQNDIQMLRRFSGGGTVYHDLGNINWSFISSREGFSQSENLEIICDMAAEFSGGLREDFSLTERGDILFRGKKITGNALAFKGSKVIHHGTLLCEADLEHVSRSLQGFGRRYGVGFRGAAVDSNPSPVMNLSEIRPESDGDMIASFYDSARKVLADAWLPDLPEEIEDADSAVLGPESTQYSSGDWHFRRTPDFSIILKNGGNISVIKGVAESFDGRSWDLVDQAELEDFESYLAFINK